MKNTVDAGFQSAVSVKNLSQHMSSGFRVQNRLTEEAPQVPFLGHVLETSSPTKLAGNRTNSCGREHNYRLMSIARCTTYELFSSSSNAGCAVDVVVSNKCVRSNN